jgi:hypothetical protein
MSGSGAQDPEDQVSQAERLREALQRSARELTGFTSQLLREARELQAAVREREKGEGHESGR